MKRKTKIEKILIKTKNIDHDVKIYALKKLKKNEIYAQMNSIKRTTTKKKNKKKRNDETISKKFF